MKAKTGMDITQFWGRGVRLSGVAERQAAEKAQALEAGANASRKQWLDALLIDELRAWESVGESDRAALDGLLVVLTMAGLCRAHADGHEQSREVRIIRGGVRIIEDCVGKGCKIARVDAQGLSAAVDTARGVVVAASAQAIGHAAVAMRWLAGCEGVA